MEVITVDSKAFKEIITKINVIAKFVTSHELNSQENDDDTWVDAYEVRTFLCISNRTLQRLRTERLINYSTIRGRIYYKISELKRLLDARIIKSDNECLMDLIHNHKSYVEQRRNLKESK